MDIQTIKEIQQAIAESSLSTKVYIGSDSQRFRDGTVKYATVVILHIDGNKGGRLFSFVEKEMDYQGPKNPRLRLVNEAYKAADIANALLGGLGDRELQIHLDLNTDPAHKSSIALKEACGLVLGMTGIQPKVKHEAWAASTAADRISK